MDCWFKMVQHNRSSYWIYWQVEVCTEDYFFLKGLLKCNVMLLSLCYGPATCTFQRLMNLVLPGSEWVTYSCLVYLDDVIIFFKSFDKPLRNKEAFFLHDSQQQSYK